MVDVVVVVGCVRVSVNAVIWPMMMRKSLHRQELLCYGRSANINEKFCSEHRCKERSARRHSVLHMCVCVVCSSAASLVVCKLRIVEIVK